MARTIAIIVIGLVIALAAVGWWRYARVAEREVEPAVVEVEAEEAESPAEVKEAPEPRVVRSYMDVVLATDETFPTTQPLGVPLDIEYAARVVLNDPIYLCSRRDLWITRADGPAVEEVLENATGEQTHVVREQVLYVHWTRGEEGRWTPAVVVLGADGSGPVLVGSDSRIELPDRAYHWPAAVSWGDRLIVPSARGVSVFEFEPELQEAYQELTADEDATESSATSRPQVLFHGRGLLAWAPWEDGRTGSRGAARYIDGRWAPLGPEQGWPEKLMHLVPLLDGSVLQVIVEEDGSTRLAMQVLDSERVDEGRIEALVEQLSDRDPEKREAAYRELTRYGPGSWPVLERLMDEQPVEARFRMQELLRNRLRPTLGGMGLVAGDLQVAARLGDGGVVLYSDAGVWIPRVDEAPQVISPAWIAIRPGRAVQLLSPALAEELHLGRMGLAVFDNRWIVMDESHGPRQFLGNHLEPLLEEEHREFDHVIGIDRRGRWLLTATPPDGRTLVIDPTLPDPRPRLPVWAIYHEEAAIGWTQEDWPAIRHGGAWALQERGWRPLDESTEPMLTDAVEEVVDENEPLLVAGDGTRYFDGREALRAVRPDGAEVVWPLPDLATGDAARPALIEAGEERLFLFNRPGRVLRIKPTPEADEPFMLEATFTRDIPNARNPQRIWLDPAGRIIIAHGGNRLAVLFPEGRIPREIALLMPARH